MTFWKKKDNLIITAFVTVFFVGLAYWYDLCCVNAAFFKSDPGNAFSIAINDSTGQTSLDKFKGKPTIVYLWATWCPSCVKKMGTLNTFAKRFQDKGGNLVAVSQDKGGVSTVRAYFTRHDYKNLGIYVESTGHLSKALGITGLPTTIFIDAQGQEVGRAVGGLDWESDKVAGLVHQYFGIDLAQ